MTTKLIYSSDDILAFYKEGGLPTVPLKSNTEGDSLLKRISQDFPEVLTVEGKNGWEGGIIHRLDTLTSGLVLVARNNETYNLLMEEQRNNRIKKEYKAEVSKVSSPLSSFEKFPYSWSGDEIVVTSFFRSYGPKGASVRPTLNIKKADSPKQYCTLIKRINPTLFLCTITQGFRHQIRSHLAWSGYPIVGDDRYGGKKDPFLHLTAYKISFVLKKREVTISL